MSEAKGVRDVLNDVIAGYRGADIDELSTRVRDAWVEADVVEDAALYAARDMVRERWSAQRRPLARLVSTGSNVRPAERLAADTFKVTFDEGRPKTTHLEVSWLVEVRRTPVSVPGRGYVVLDDMSAEMLDEVAGARRDAATSLTVMGDAFAALAEKVRRVGAQCVAELSDGDIEADLTAVARGLPSSQSA